MALVGTALVDGWTVEPIAVAGLLAAAIFYANGIQRLARRGRGWPLTRTIPFYSGLLLIVVATQSPFAAQDTKLFSAHVGQHLLLAMGAPPLLCLGAPITLFLQGASRSNQTRLLKVLHSRIVKLLSFPLVSWLLFVGSLFVLYYSGLYELSLRNQTFHEVVHLHFIASGFLFFSAVVAIDPHPWRMPHGARLLYVGLTLPAHAFLALALLSATKPLAADWYLTTTAHDMGQLLRDQHLGAGLMWVAGDLIAIAVVGIVATQWARLEEREALREDRIVDLERAAEASSDFETDDRTPITIRQEPLRPQ